ncbi:LysR substrate-binding domain-containing protein [Shewanella marina]|uniref:LysR substrate-binding domain-containing protein n=1 Tax=Shewanella marina TaxID=487319 RepID=UPI00046E5B1B|nr:LysR substrate-binding domain-containing protein [Shewanella marina]
MRITLKQLAVFDAVARTSQVAKAALQLNLSSPAVSMALSELEKQLNVKLFERIGNRLHLNAQGNQLLPLAIDVLHRVEQIEHVYNQDSLDLTGQLSVAASTTVGNYIVAKKAVCFSQQHPQTQVDVNITNSQDVVDSIINCISEVGYIEGHCTDNRVDVKRWHSDKLVIFTTLDDPLAGQTVTAQQLQAKPWVMRELGSGTREVFLNETHKLDLQPQIKYSFSTPEAIKIAVQQGAGYGVLSELAISADIERGEFAVIKVKGLSLTRQFYQITHKNRQVSSLAQAFINYCKTIN